MHGNTTDRPTIPSTVDGSDLSILTPTAGQLKQGRPREKESRGGKKTQDRDLTGKTCRKKKRDRKGERRGRNLLYAVLLATKWHVQKATKVSIKISLVLAPAQKLGILFQSKEQVSFRLLRTEVTYASARAVMHFILFRSRH